MEENKNLEMEEVQQETVEEKNDGYYVEDPCTELEEMAEREETEQSSGAALIFLGAALTIGAYAGGKWAYKKGKAFVKKKLDERAVKKQELVKDEEINKEDVVDGECKEVEGTSKDEKKK